MRFGVQTAPQQISWTELRETWQEVETLGFDSLWVNDHLLPSVGPSDAPNFEGWTMVGAMAALTTRVRIGVMVASNTFRHPAILAKMATSVDHISGGRLILGIGSGYFAQEHQVYGISLYTSSQRARQLEEALQVIHKLWTEENASFAGTYYRLTKAPFAPKPIQKPHPPIMIGGTGEKLTLPLVAKYADLWNSGGTVERMGHLVDVLKRHCDAIGRDHSEIEKTVITTLGYRAGKDREKEIVARAAAISRSTPAEARRNVIVGSAQECLDTIARFGQAGVTHFIFSMTPPYLEEGIQAFAEEVIPRARQ